MIGSDLVKLEKTLLEDEKLEFQDKKFTFEELKNFRKRNKTFWQLEEFKKQNILNYELFAVWTEYILSKEFRYKDLFQKKYNSDIRELKDEFEKIIRFYEYYGSLAVFYQFGLAKIVSIKRIKRLLESIYDKRKLDNSKVILLTGSKKEYSDIDLFASSNCLKSLKNNWLDLVVFNEYDFERRIKLFEVQVTYPIMYGEFIYGDKEYLVQKRIQIQKQPITEEIIEHNLKLSKEQKERALSYSNDSKEYKIGLNYSKTNLVNALNLKEGKRVVNLEEIL